MAWISAGNSNNELVEQLIENRVIKSKELEIAFKCTDRGDFVLQEYRSQAYLDRPFKQRYEIFIILKDILDNYSSLYSYVHISAPHMYVTILNELELSQGLSFLNIGSGSGYLSCLAACLLGDSGLSHGIDVSRQVVVHSEKYALKTTCSYLTITIWNFFLYFCYIKIDVVRNGLRTFIKCVRVGK